jgi:DNA primase small subunit
MPHSVSPESTPVEDLSQATSVVDTTKLEEDVPSQDITMADAPSPSEAEKAKVDLEDLFDDEDSDVEFPSSAPQIKPEEELSQPAPMYTLLPSQRLHD